jgi:WD40 repeat protein
VQVRETMRHTTYIGPNVMYSENLHNRLLVDMLRSLVITHSQRFFDRRVERVVWSPRSRSTLAVGSHGGDVYLWNYENELRTSKIVDGCGKGGAINDMKFSQEGDRLYTVGHDGHIRSHDTETAVAVHSFATKSFGSVPKPGNCCDHW